MKFDDQKQKLIFFLVGVNLLPHALSIPSWIVGVSFFFVFWRLMHVYRSWPLPRAGFLRGLVALCCLGIFLQFGTVLGQEPATSLLVIMVSAKLFELRKFRDAILTVLFCYLLLMAKLIESQSMEITLFMMADVLLITSTLAIFHSPQHQGQTRYLFRRSFLLALQSVPLTFALFIVFPRFNLSFWNQSHRLVAETGFSDSIRPGSVADLAQSNKVAFRVSFPDRQPGSIEKMYWRGLVLTESRGLDWDKGEYHKSIPSYRYATTGEEIAQEIFFEPSSHPILFALDWPNLVVFPGDPKLRFIQTSNQRTFEAKFSLSSRQFYRAFSSIESAQVAWEQVDLSPYLKVGGTVDKRVKDLALSFRNGLQLHESKNLRGSENRIAERVVSYFVQENFAYTLRPGKVTSLEDFLFSKKRGFCEHFAGAMASLLRLSGVPSRVVVGFQGGTSSLLRDYYLVRYLDAHAWVEYWDSLQKSWVRSDPIQFISPQRLAMGGESYRDMMNDRYFDVENSDLTQFLRGGLGEMASRVRLIWDQSESLWINFLLRYDWSFQKEIIQGLGLGEASRWIFAFLAIVLTLLALVVAIFVFRLGHDRVDPDLELYRLLCAHLSRFGLQKEVGEGPYDYWGRARNQFPQARDKLDSLFKALIHGRYGQLNLTRKMRRSLQHKIKRLRLQNESGRRSLSNS